jgi:DNA polymerase-3 subunit delta'
MSFSAVAERDTQTWPIWGNLNAVETMRDAIVNDRVRHAYLIGGPAGVGKTAFAMAFVSALCCDSPPAPGIACGSCLSCRKISRGVHPDVQTFGLESQAAASEKSGTKNTTLTIETVRELSSGTALRPTEGRWKVILIEDAETLQEIAQEALLKTLEEPPRFVVLILLCNDPELLLPTIRSRCQIVDLRRVPRAAIIDGLVARGIARDRAEEVASVSGGLPGLANDIARNPKGLARQQESVDRALDWIQGSGYDRLVTAVRLGDTFTKKRPDVYQDLETLLGVWRDALLVHAAQLPHMTYRGIAERLDTLAAGWTLVDIHKGICSVQQCLADLEANVRPRLALESMVLQWPISRSNR